VRLATLEPQQATPVSAAMLPISTGSDATNIDRQRCHQYRSAAMPPISNGSDATNIERQ
jgi:hypothetical protein